MSVQASIKNKIGIENEPPWESRTLQPADNTNPHQCATYSRANGNKNQVPIFTVNDIEVHIYSSDEHMAVDSDFVDCRRRQGVRHDHEAHDLAGDGPPVGQGHPQAEPACDVDHLEQSSEDRTRSHSHLGWNRNSASLEKCEITPGAANISFYPLQSEWLSKSLCVLKAGSNREILYLSMS